MPDWSLTNPDLRNYQDYDINLEYFDDWLDGETINGRQSPVRSIREKHLQIEIIKGMPRFKTIKTSGNSKLGLHRKYD